MTKRQVFYSFHFKNDSWRAGQVRNIGVVEGNTPVSSNGLSLLCYCINRF